MPAHIFPKDDEMKDIPYSERLVYDYLSKLNDSFYIFHSVQWVKKNHNKNYTWKENDFLILNKNLGMLVMEVKGGIINYKDGVFHQKNIQTNETKTLDEKKKNDPLSQAVDGVYHYRKLLDEIEYNFYKKFPVEVAVWFPGCEIGEKIKTFPLSYREIKEAVLDSTVFSFGTKKIFDIYEFYNASAKTNIKDEEFNKVLNLIAQDFELVAAPIIKKGELDHVFLKFTNEQIGLLDYISEQKSATIQGVAGTGKTIVAKEAARKFGAEGRKVLFLCFNTFLCADLKHRYPNRNVEYHNIHSFIATHSKMDISSTNTRVKELMKIDWDKIDFDDVVIDEGQDFENEEVVFFKDFMEIKDGRFLVFYDKNQLINSKEIPIWIEKAECKLVLTKNCRNTYEIAITSYNIIDVDIKQKIRMVRGDDTTISFISGEPLVHLRNLINYYVDKCAYEFSDICILTLKTEDKSILNNISKISGINISRDRNNSSVFFTTARKFKGLESRVVIVIDLDEKDFSNEEDKRVFYVACSRATQRLSLFIDGDEEKLKKISTAIGGMISMPSKGKILQKTKSKIFSI